jgi:cytochrome c553
MHHAIPHVMKSAAQILVSLAFVTCAATAFANTAAPATAPATATATKPAAAEVVKPDAAKGEVIANGACVACHTNDGSRGVPANPILQGQHPEYVVKQLTEFKSGKRANAIMMGFASMLSEADMKNVAANKDTVALGEKIYRGGIAERSIPACAGCHSPTGSGIPALYPRLGGQHAEYTETQLIAYRGGTRNNSLQMTGIAAKLNDREIKAVSDYLAGLR